MRGSRSPAKDGQTALATRSLTLGLLSYGVICLLDGRAVVQVLGPAGHVLISFFLFFQSGPWDSPYLYLCIFI